MAPKIEDIVLTIGKILEDAEGPMKLSLLGQLLNQRLDASIRQVLGNKPLGDLVLEHFGDRFEIQGHGPHKEVGRIGEWVLERPSPRYDPRFWKHFSSSVGEGLTRWISDNDPYRSIDQTTAPQDGDYIEIEGHFLPQPGQELLNRGRFIRQNIETWARAHSFDLSRIETPSELGAGDAKSSARLARNKSADFGTRAIQAILDAIPEDERSNYSLPLNLVARLMNSED